LGVTTVTAAFRHNVETCISVARSTQARKRILEVLVVVKIATDDFRHLFSLPAILPVNSARQLNSREEMQS